jgi:hypothetical protein
LSAITLHKPGKMPGKTTVSPTKRTAEAEVTGEASWPVSPRLRASLQAKTEWRLPYRVTGGQEEEKAE